MFHINNDIPDWNYNLHQYQFSGSITSKVFIDDIEVGSENDILAAFINDEPRGYAFGTAIPGQLGEGYAFLLLIW